MKLQSLVFKVEELKALIVVYENGVKTLAQANALRDTLIEETNDSEREAIESSIGQFTARMSAVENLLMSRTRTTSLDDAIAKVEEHIARLQQVAELRTEQVQLQTQLDLELAVGEVSTDVRRQVDAKLSDLRTRLETLVSIGHQALGSAQVITLV
jgi:chromosome segregation ATPase